MARCVLSDDDREFLACMGEARRLVRAGLADQRTIDYIRRWEPLERELITRSVRSRTVRSEVA